MRNFVYLIGDSKTREVLVVDGAWDVDVSEHLSIAWTFVPVHNHQKVDYIYVNL